MKKLTSLFAAIALLTPVVLSAAAFEGKVTMQMTGSRGRSMPMTFSVKPGFTRIDMSAHDHTVGVIIDQAKRETTILMPQQKMYMVRPMPAEDASAPAQGGSGGNVSVEKTGVHEKILGYDTTKYIAKTSEGTTELWVTDELGTFMGLGNGGGNPMAGAFGGRQPAQGGGHAWEGAFRGKNMFPLRVTTTNAQGTETFRMEATSVEKVSLPDSVFAPPADYRKLDIENMMRGMGMPGMGGMRPRGGG
ncbi:MAG TPA: DUF4412 domain-containing protein [Opitutaceae bacterium]|nr:DUF4412 domain-containing protein [Opitutaceae bacterium]